MDVAAGANPLHDLLPQIAAFGEVKGTGLAGLLRQLPIADVGAEARRSLEQTKLLKNLLSCINDACVHKLGSQPDDCCTVRP